jgi:hypothetical protein
MAVGKMTLRQNVSALIFRFNKWRLVFGNVRDDKLFGGNKILWKML